jgi:hypothetical protein
MIVIPNGCEESLLCWDNGIQSSPWAARVATCGKDLGDFGPILFNIKLNTLNIKLSTKY